MIKEPEQYSRRELLQGIIERKDRDGLHDWIEASYGINIPTVAVCDDHDAPFDFVADYIFGVYDFLIVLANRSGGKTMNFGVLDATMFYQHENAEIGAVGAIQAQAQKAYEYFRNFSGEYPFNENVESSTITKSAGKNGSKLQILTGTMSGVNSPHPQIVFLDEIDLMAWQVLQQALSMAQSKGGISARTVLTSTRKFANGPMQRMMDEAKEKGTKVYQWCIWEVIERLPDDPAEREHIFKTFGGALPQHIDRANGYYSWKDTIGKFVNLDPEVWETEWLCKRPGLKGVVYGTSYSDENNLITDWKPPKNWYIYLFEDFGSSEDHPDVVLFVAIPPQMDRLVVFDELYMTNMGTEDIWTMVNDKLATYGHHLPDIKASKSGTVRGWIPDPHNLTEIINRRRKGAPILGPLENAKLYIIKNGISAVRHFLNSGRLMITDLCPNLRGEFLSYRYSKNQDGSYSDTPVKKDDHGPDAVRYGIVRLFSIIAARAFEMQGEEQPANEPEVKKEDDRPWVPKRPEAGARDQSDSITSGMSEDSPDWR